MGDEEEEGRKFLERFAEEFPATLEDDSPLPVSLQSRRVSLEELHGEALEVGLKLLAARYCSVQRESVWIYKTRPTRLLLTLGLAWVPHIPGSSVLARSVTLSFFKINHRCRIDHTRIKHCNCNFKV